MRRRNGKKDSKKDQEKVSEKNIMERRSRRRKVRIFNGMEKQKGVSKKI